MPLLTEGNKRKNRKGEKIGVGIKTPVSPMVEYRRALYRLNRLLKQRTANIGELIRGGASAIEVSQRIEQDLKETNEQFDRASLSITDDMIRELSKRNRERIENAIRIGLGVNSAKIIDTPEIKEALELATAQNVNLIKSIPEQHFAKVSQAIFSNYRGETFQEGSLTKRLTAIGNITDRRAKFIARDQTVKFVSNLNRIRQEDAGIDGYIWRNSMDERVVGNPGGLYQKGNKTHGDHWNREGKKFSWNEPPHDGHPGQAPGCRCYPEPVLNIEKVNRNAIRL